MYYGNVDIKFYKCHVTTCSKGHLTMYVGFDDDDDDDDDPLSILPRTSILTASGPFT